MIALQSNMGLKILALTLSIFLWGFVKFTQTPFSSTLTQADIQVPLEVLTDPEMTALDAPDSVRVTVRGADDAIRALRPNSITARMDLRGKGEGLMMPSVTVNQPGDITIISVQPDRITVRVDPTVTVDVPVEVKLTGKVAAGYTASRPVVSPQSVKVSGPRTQVQQVKQVLARVKIEGLEMSLMERVSLEPVDEDNVLVHRVELVPRNGNVSVNVLPDVVPKTLPVFLEFTGTLRPNLSMQEPRYAPRMVPVIFPHAKGAVPTALSTVPINLSSLGPGETKMTLRIEPPTNGRLVKDQTVEVVINVKRSGGAGAAKGKKPGR